jgi:ABC-type nitrate/sulfonate/bicarbonate transport system permease component
MLWFGQKAIQGRSRWTTLTHVGATSRLEWGPALLGLGLCLVLWTLAVEFSRTPEVLKTPRDIWAAAVKLDRGQWTELLKGLTQTLRVGSLGLLLGVFGGAVLAACRYFVPSIGRVIESVLLVTQTIPLVALVPMIVSLLNRGDRAVIAVAGVATYYVFYIAIDHGFRQLPVGYADVIRAHGGGRTKVLLCAALPNAVPYLAEGLRLTVPRLLGAAVLGEYLLDMSGIGGLLYKFRAAYTLVWLLVAITGFVAGLLTLTLYLVERLVETRLARVHT